jgi:hypothetical protein
MGPPAVSDPHREPCCCIITTPRCRDNEPITHTATRTLPLFSGPPGRQTVIRRLWHRHQRQNAQGAIVQATRRSIHQSRRQANVDWTANFPHSLSIQPQSERATSADDVRTTKKFCAPSAPFPTLVTRSLAPTAPASRQQSKHAAAPRPPVDCVYRYRHSSPSSSIVAHRSLSRPLLSRRHVARALALARWLRGPRSQPLPDAV